MKIFIGIHLIVSILTFLNGVSQDLFKSKISFAYWQGASLIMSIPSYGVYYCLIK